MNKEFYFQVKEYLLQNECQFRDDLIFPSDNVSGFTLDTSYKCECGCQNSDDSGVFLFNGLNSNKIGFKDESFILMWKTESDVEIYSILDRDTRKATDISKAEFFIYLDILVEMDRLRKERIRLRKLVINKEIVCYSRDKLISEII